MNLIVGCQSRKQITPLIYYLVSCLKTGKQIRDGGVCEYFQN